MRDLPLAYVEVNPSVATATTTQADKLFDPSRGDARNRNGRAAAEATVLALGEFTHALGQLNAFVTGIGKTRSFRCLDFEL